MIAFGVSSKGLVRENNEDSYYMPGEDDSLKNIFIIADGMGGCKAGEVASRLAIDVFLKYIKENTKKKISRNIIRKGIEKANEEVFKAALTEDEFYKMGTTLLVAVAFQTSVLIANVGDSRAYLYRHDKLTQITEDHSYVMELVKMGNITVEEAKKHSKRNIITRAIGMKDKIDVDFFHIEITSSKDKLLLCSDGLFTMADDLEIEKIIKTRKGVEYTANSLVDFANMCGGYDNTSVILIEFGGK